MSILSLNHVSLSIGNIAILEDVTLHIQPKDKIALVGRNGAGKTTLLKLLQQDITADSGQVHRQSGLCVAGLMQDVPVSRNETVYHFLVKHLGESGEALAQYRSASLQGDLDQMAQHQQQIDALNAWDLLPQVETMAQHLGLPCDDVMENLSGGMRRRVLLGAALLAKPDLLLLDEPTNHLDIDAIEWLEDWLKNYPGSLLVVTHDRQFLSRVATRILEIDRGKLHAHDCDYATYLDRREAILLSEQKQFDLFDKHLKEEETWLRAGIKARRTRNEGRVRRLLALREEYRRRREQLGKIKSVSLETSYSGKLVLEAQAVHYEINHQSIIRDFSFLLMRGDRVGIIGPNGCGKTTLVRLLLNELTPGSGSIRQGTLLQAAYFEQLRHQLNEQDSLMANVAEGADYVTINGQQKHVASYLREFLFSPEQFNQPVFSLSGGERNRLLLAKLFAKPINLLVMDEPTNDLDIETLELLESLLMDYQGTLLIISHDREFLNQVTSNLLVYEGEGHFNEYVGSYEDYRRIKDQQKKQPSSTDAPVSKTAKKTYGKMSSREQQELKQLPQHIEALEAKIQALQLEIATPDFYQQPTEKIEKIKKELAQQESELDALLYRWEYLENKNK